MNSDFLFLIGAMVILTGQTFVSLKWHPKQGFICSVIGALVLTISLSWRVSLNYNEWNSAPLTLFLGPVFIYATVLIVVNFVVYRTMMKSLN